MRALILAFAVIFVFGCGQDHAAQPTPDAPAAAAAPEPAAAEAPPVDPLADSLPPVLVEVDGIALTREEALEQTQNRLAGVNREEMDPAQARQMEERMLQHVVEQFVARTLLLEEAERRGITVTEEDETAAFEKIAEVLPEGKTPEEVMRNSPMGEERMREEVLIGVRINKLLTDVMPEEAAVTDQEVSEFKEDYKERLADNPLADERIAEIILNRKRQLAVRDLLEELKSQAEITYHTSAAVGGE